MSAATAPGIVTRPSRKRGRVAARATRRLPSYPVPGRSPSADGARPPRASERGRALGQPAVEGVYRPEDRLVVGGRGAVWPRPRQPAHRRRRDRLEPRHGQVEVEVVAVGRVDVRAQPHPGYAKVTSQSGIQAAIRPAAPSSPIHGPLRLGGQPLAVEPESAQPGLRERVVVVPGHEEHPAPVMARPSASTSGRATSSAWASGRSRLLDQVAEQDEPVRAGDRLGQGACGAPSPPTSASAMVPRWRSDTRPSASASWCQVTADGQRRSGKHVAVSRAQPPARFGWACRSSALQPLRRRVPDLLQGHGARSEPQARAPAPPLPRSSVPGGAADPGRERGTHLPRGLRVGRAL